jgi:membrane peptidoglycan carboxypeptidase
VVIQALSRYGLTASIDIGLPINYSQQPDKEKNWQELLYGDNRIRVSPLQIAHAFSIFSSAGQQSTPNLLAAINTAESGWVASEPSTSAQVISSETAQDISRLLASEEISGWEISTQAQDENGTYSWYAAGTSTLGSSNPFVFVVVTEEDNAEELRWIGRQIYKLVTES